MTIKTVAELLMLFMKWTLYILYVKPTHEQQTFALWQAYMLKYVLEVYEDCKFDLYQSIKQNIFV